MDKWIKKMSLVYTREYYLAIKKNQISLFATAYMDLEGIVLSKNKSHREMERGWGWDEMG